MTTARQIRASCSPFLENNDLQIAANRVRAAFISASDLAEHKTPGAKLRVTDVEINGEEWTFVMDVAEGGE